VFSEIISFAGAVEATGLDADSATTFLVFFKHYRLWVFSFH
jgi:hypothetical protein